MRFIGASPPALIIETLAWDLAVFPWTLICSLEGLYSHAEKNILNLLLLSKMEKNLHSFLTQMLINLKLNFPELTNTDKFRYEFQSIFTTPIMIRSQ